MEWEVVAGAAHPDDELLGFGGTSASHGARGDRVRLAVMCEGVSTRYTPDWDAEVRKQAQEAARILGVTDLILGNLPDQRLETLPLCEMVQKVEAVFAELHPELVYTHLGRDMNS